MYVTDVEYAILSRAHSLPAGDETRYIEAAERDIDGLTYGRIRAIGFESLTDFQQRMVKQAVVDQADFRAEYAELLDNPLSSYTVGGVSMSWDTARIKSSGGIAAPDGVTALLRQTGLAYRGVPG